MSAHPYDVLSLNNGANIIFTPCPGTKTQNLADSIATLKAAGTHMLLSLMPQKELEKNNVETINSECNKHDIYELSPTLGEIHEMIPVLKLVPGIKDHIEALRSATVAVK